MSVYVFYDVFFNSTVKIVIIFYLHIYSSEPSDDESENESSQSLHKNSPSEMSDAIEEEEDLNYCKLQTLKELFPQQSDQALLEVQYYNYQEIAIGIPWMSEDKSLSEISCLLFPCISTALIKI